jgi:hypothetical protein
MSDDEEDEGHPQAEAGTSSKFSRASQKINPPLNFQIFFTNLSMAPTTTGRKRRPSARGKNDVRSLKRKRDVEDHEKLQKAVEELVSQS